MLHPSHTRKKTQTSKQSISQMSLLGSVLVKASRLTPRSISVICSNGGRGRGGERRLLLSTRSQCHTIVTHTRFSQTYIYPTPFIPTNTLFIKSKIYLILIIYLRRLWPWCLPRVPAVGWPLQCAHSHMPRASRCVHPTAITHTRANTNKQTCKQSIEQMSLLGSVLVKASRLTPRSISVIWSNGGRGGERRLLLSTWSQCDTIVTHTRISRNIYPTPSNLKYISFLSLTYVVFGRDVCPVFQQ